MKRILLAIILGLGACSPTSSTYDDPMLARMRRDSDAYQFEFGAITQRITNSSQAFRSANGCERRHLLEVLGAIDELERLPSRAGGLSSYNRGLNAAAVREMPSELNRMATAAADRRCYDLARTIYLKVIELFPEAWAAAPRQRAQIGIDDLRAQRR